MRFEEPLWLLAALPVAAAAAASALLVERRRAAMAYPLPADAPPPGALAALSRTLPGALQAAAALLCVVALARPQKARTEIGAPTAGIDILLVLDTSDSMRALDFAPQDRMTVAKETAARFVAGRANDRIGLVVFGGAPVLACPLTLDYESLSEFLEGVEPNMTLVGGTAIGDGVATAVNHLKSGRAKSRVIVLLTDGNNNAGVIDPVTAAKAAASYGVKIYAVGAGKRGPAMMPVDTEFGRTLAPIPDELDEETLEKVAAQTGGRYFRATTAQELERVFAEIDAMEKSESRRPVSVAYADLYAWLLVPAAALLAAEMLLSRTLLFRLP